MRVSPASRWGSKSAMVLSTTAAGTISQIARGVSSFLTRSARDVAPTAFSVTSSVTAFRDAADFGQSRVQKVLMPEPRVDGHHQHLVDVGQDFLKNACRRRWIDNDARTLSESSNALHRAMQIVVPLPGDEKGIGTSPVK